MNFLIFTRNLLWFAIEIEARGKWDSKIDGRGTSGTVRLTGEVQVGQ